MAFWWKMCEFFGQKFNNSWLCCRRFYTTPRSDNSPRLFSDCPTFPQPSVFQANVTLGSHHRLSSLCNRARKCSAIVDAELDSNVGWTRTLLNNEMSANLWHQHTHTHHHHFMASFKTCRLHSGGWIRSQVVRALDLRLDGREFDSRPLYCQVTYIQYIQRNLYSAKIVEKESEALAQGD